MPGPLAAMFAGLQGQDESRFRKWYGPLARKLGIDQNPDSPEHHYDNRAFYHAMLKGDAISPDRPGGHFPSTFKTEGHPRTFLDDGTGKIFDTRTATYLDGSPVPPDRLRASEQSPDMPGYAPPGPPHGGMLEQDNPWNPRKGVGPRPFRDPMQAGPEPPAGIGPLSQLYGGR